jgi:serine phosphatase RsbU (regulator of sigma subunit)
MTLISIIPLLCGQWGVLGLGSGYMLVSFILNYSSNLSQLNIFYLINTLIIVILSYFIFKLFYAFNFNNKLPTLHLNNISNLIKFMLVACIGNAFFVYLSICNYQLFYPEMIFNNAPFNYFLSDYVLFLNLNLVFNILIISIVNLTNIKIYKIKRSKHFLKYNKNFDPIILLFSITLIIQVIYNILIGTLDVINSESILFNIIILIFIVIFKPNSYYEINKKYNTPFSEIMIFFILLMNILFSIVKVVWYAYIEMSDGIFNFSDFMDYSFGIDELINYLIILFFAIIIVYYIEKKFSKPLQSIANLANYYIKNRFSQQEHDNSKLNIKYILNKLDYLSNNKYEIGFLSKSIKSMIINIERYIIDLKEFTAEKEKINTELKIASKIQRNAIPNKFPPFPNRLNDFDIFASYIPAKNVGGDFYDYFLIDNDHLVIIIGDVSGKGVPAALFMMMVKTLIKDQLNLGLSPSAAFIKVNNELNENKNEKMFVTVWLGILNINSGEMTYVNAGHPSPFLFSKSKNQYNILESKPNFVLGGMENIDYKSSEIKINTGDRLYLFTDGIIESINQNEEEFSVERLANVLNENHTLKIKELISKITNELHDFSKGVEQFDDETMLILEYKKKN